MTDFYLLNINVCILNDENKLENLTLKYQYIYIEKPKQKDKRSNDKQKISKYNKVILLGIQ